jgi:hypothetical protein
MMSERLTFLFEKLFWNSRTLVRRDFQAVPIREHIMASGALPPAFPAVRMDGELYWDDGILSNTPTLIRPSTGDGLLGGAWTAAQIRSVINLQGRSLFGGEAWT